MLCFIFLLIGALAGWFGHYWFSKSRDASARLNADEAQRQDRIRTFLRWAYEFRDQINGPGTPEELLTLFVSKRHQFAGRCEVIRRDLSVLKLPEQEHFDQVREKLVQRGARIDQVNSAGERVGHREFVEELERLLDIVKANAQ
jgi:hypothetical protein